MMSKCWKCHLRETKFAKFPGGGACPQTPLEARTVGARLSAFGTKRASLFLLKRGWNVCDILLWGDDFEVIFDILEGDETVNQQFVATVNNVSSNCANLRV